MSEVIVFHHALGLTSGVVGFADQLRDAGHTVHTPDLYDGQTFESLESAVEYAKGIGFETITAKAITFAESLPAELVYIGFSLGVVAAQRLAQTRSGARGAVLVSACLPRSEFGEAWPASVPVQIHSKENDPEFDNGWDLPAAREIVNEATDGELVLYPGEGHLFADNSLSSFDADATTLFISHMLKFLDRV